MLGRRSFFFSSGFGFWFLGWLVTLSCLSYRINELREGKGGYVSAFYIFSRPRQRTEREREREANAIISSQPKPKGRGDE